MEMILKNGKCFVVLRTTNTDIELSDNEGEVITYGETVIEPDIALLQSIDDKFSLLIFIILIEIVYRKAKVWRRKDG